jgi:hypothetical protein
MRHQDYNLHRAPKISESALDNMDLFDILGKDGIVSSPYQTPGKVYHQNDIIEAIKIHHFEGQVAIEPEFHRRGSKLLEIRLCLDHDAIDYISIRWRR